ncbi:hypothetical protein [Pseudomonas sivasensis]|uniref:hypothetical protein n=1 Tax=Pseudomonas sivasensis TaxID=1880678 RepID=UPI003B9F838D
MVSTSGSTKQILTSVNAKINSTSMGEADTILSALIESISIDELKIIAPELRETIEQFFPRRRRRLSELLQTRLASSNFEKPGDIKRSPIERQLDDYARRLEKLQNSHIFQWHTFYLDTVGFIYRELYETLENAENWSDALIAIRKQFSHHGSCISSRGLAYSLQHGLNEEVARYKSLSGLQQFLYLVMNLYIDSQEKIVNANQSRLHRRITSAFLCGVLEGYANTLGWEKLIVGYKHWLPALGFTTGADALSLMQKSETTLQPLIDLFDTVVPILLAIDSLETKFNGSDYLATRVSRVYQSTPANLEITLHLVNGSIASEVSAVCVFAEEISELFEVELIGRRLPSVTVLRASSIVRNWIEQHEKTHFIDATFINGKSEKAYDLSEIVRSEMEKQIEVNSNLNKTQLVHHNYAADFPLEDPDSRRLFTVERHSVKTLLKKFEHGSGIHLWCSVRRSGKTTAATSLSGHSKVIFQTMDHVTDQLHYNIFEQRIKSALQSVAPIAHDFFESVIGACLEGAGIEKNKGKIIFLLDEYESLFGLLDAMVNANPLVKFNVALPLLSQMVRFSANNLLIFMGQSPDAYHIIPTQNQLSPLVRQHHFPLFEHIEGAEDSEFGQFIKKVLSQNLPFTPSFADAVFAETSGHPYLTVNLMVDFCDWLASNNSPATTALDANSFELFTKARLSPSVLSRSTFYSFFKHQLSGYLSEQTRKDELWLYAIARVLNQIGQKHPKALSCPIARYNELANMSLAGSTTTAPVLLVSGVKSNFLKHNDGHVKPAVRLMARLAACSIPEIS